MPGLSPSARIRFSADEHRARVQTVAAGVRARGLDAVLAWSRGGATLDSAADVLWLTGFYNPWLAVPDSQCWSGQSHCAALITAAGECVLITNIPGNEWREGGIVADEVLDEPFIDLGATQAIRSRGLERARVGLAGRTVLTLALHDRLRAELPDVKFVPCDEVLIEARRPKSPAEVEAIRETGRVGALTMEAMLAASQPGAREVDVAIASYAATIGAGGVPYSMSLATGPDEDRLCPMTLPTWSDRTLQEGDLWHCDLTGIVGGYLFDFARTTVVGGSPTDEQLEMIEAAIATVEAVIERIEPGRPIGESVRHGHAVQRRLTPFSPPVGKHDYQHLGHTLGLGFGDIWLYDNEQRPFEEHMYVAVEVVVARPGGGFAMFEQNLIVGEDGPEVVTECRTRPWKAL